MNNLTNINKIRTQVGLTLIEVLIVLVIVGLLLAAGVSGLGGLFSNQTMASVNDAFRSHMAYARSSSLENFVSVCATEDGDTCSEDPNWSRGWLVFSGQCNAFINTNILRVHFDASSTLSMTTDATSCVTFDDGQASDVAFELCPQNGQRGYAFNLSASGILSSTMAENLCQ